ncbi:MAG: SMC-Scp complex subunit ScpB [Candidatus Aenigmatarchaeota archaeon]
MTDPKELALVEAVLFATNEPLSFEQLRKITKMRSNNLEQLMKQLKKKYEKDESGIFLSETGGFKLSVKQEFSSVVSGLAKADLSKGLLRVLSIIACHEPVKQADIVRIIGNRTYEYTKELQDMGFIVSEKKGNTKILKTTKQFEDYFSTRKEEIKSLYKKIQTDKQPKPAEEKPEKTQ